jgi:hypothetical protein
MADSFEKANYIMAATDSSNCQEDFANWVRLQDNKTTAANRTVWSIQVYKLKESIAPASSSKVARAEFVRQKRRKKMHPFA